MPLQATGNNDACHENSRSVCQRLITIDACRVEHHFDHAFDMTIRRREPADVHAEATGERRARLIGIELLAFNLTRLEDVLGERAEERASSLMVKPSASMWPVRRPCLCWARESGISGNREGLVVPLEPRPVRQLMNIGEARSPQSLRRSSQLYSPHQSIIRRVFCGEYLATILRTPREADRLAHEVTRSGE